MRYKKLHPDAIEPQQALASAGYDFFSTHDLVIPSGRTGKVKTGVAVELPIKHVGLLRDRSSLGSKGILVAGGVIDPDYRGEIIVCLYNSSPSDFVINKGDKISQMLVLPFHSSDMFETDVLEETERGTKGFGSTDASTK